MFRGDEDGRGANWRPFMEFGVCTWLWRPESIDGPVAPLVVWTNEPDEPEMNQA